MTFNRTEITDLRAEHSLEAIIAMEHEDDPEAFRRLCSMGVATITGLASDVLEKLTTEEDLSGHIEEQLTFLRANGDIEASDDDIRKASIAGGWFLARTGGFIPDVYYIEVDQAEYRTRQDALSEWGGRGLIYPADACIGKYETEEEARDALAKMPTKIEYNRYKYSCKWIRTNYTIYRTVEETSEPSCDIWIASSELPEEEADEEE